MPNNAESALRPYLLRACILIQCLGLVSVATEPVHADPTVIPDVIQVERLRWFRGCYQMTMADGARADPNREGCLQYLNNVTQGWRRAQTNEFGMAQDPTATLRGQDCCCSTWNLWSSGYGVGGRVHGDGNVPGAEYSVGGVQLGLHRDLDDERSLGIYGNYGHTSITRSTWSQSGDVDSALVGIYTGLRDGPYHSVLDVAYGYNDYSTQRAAGLGTAVADFHGHLASVYAEGGRDYCLRGTGFQPFAGLQYIQLHSSRFSETGAGAANLTVDNVDVGSLQSALGIRLSRARCTHGGWTVRSTCQAAWMHEFLETQVTVDIGSAVPVPVNCLDPGRDRAVLGTGLVLEACGGLQLFFNYDLQLNSRQTFHVGYGGLAYEW